MSAVAVTIPSYNHATFLGAALASIAAQTLRPERIVVVDDGSTDGSPEVIRAFAAAHPELHVKLIEQANAGAHVALNRAIAEAGDVDFVSILNSDDVYEPTRLAECAAYLEAHPSCEVVCTGFRLIGTEGNLLPADHPKVRRMRLVWANPDRDPAEWLGESNFTKTSSNYFIRSAYARKHPFRAYRYAHDYFFASVAALDGLLAVLPRPLLRYRTHSSNTIKADGGAAVAKELIRLQFDLLRDLAPRLAESREVRTAALRYFRNLLKNASDFRSEVFLALVARLLAEAPELMDGPVAALASADFPELSAPPTRERLEKPRSSGFLWGRLARFRTQ